MAARTAAPALAKACLWAAMLAWAPAAEAAAAAAEVAASGPAVSAADDRDPMPAASEAARLFGAGRYAEALPYAQQALATAERVLAADDPLLAEFLTLLGNLRRAAGQFDAAELPLQRALALREKALGPQAPETAVSLNNLALLHLSRGDARRALPLLERALAIREKAFGPDAPEVATALTNLGSVLDESGRTQEALAMHARALSIRERVYGADDPRTLTTLNNLAEATGTLGQYREALPLHRRVLAGREKALGPDHPDTAVSVNNLAALLESLGRLDEALALHRRALASNEAALGPQHPATVVSLGNLASVLTGLGRLDEALVMAQRALAVNTQALGADAPAVATSALRLAYVHQQRGEFVQALVLAQRALQIREATRGPQHPDTALALNNLAEIYSAMGEYGQAVVLHRRALQIREAALGPIHPDTASGLNNLATLYKALGQFELAEPLLQRALAINEQVYGDEHSSTARSLNNLGQLEVSRGQSAQGLPLAQRALAIQEKALGPTHPDLAITLNNLAGMLEDLQRAPEALPLHLRALAVREQALGPRHPAVAATLNNLAALYETLGEPQRALPLYRRALRILQAGAGPATQPVLLAAVHTRLGRFHEARGDTDLAIFHLKQAVNLTQGLRAGASTLESAFQQSLARGVESRYRRLAELLVRQVRLPEAEQVLALLKSQERMDFVRGDVQDSAGGALSVLSPAERDLADRLDGNAQRLARLYAELDALDGGVEPGAEALRRRAQLTERIQVDSEALDSLLGDAVQALSLAPANPANSAGRAAFEAAVAERDAISNRLAVLNERGGGRAAALYIVPGEKTTTFLVVTARGAVGVTGGVGEAQLNRLAAQLRQAIEKRAPDYKKVAGELHAALIAPVAALLDSARIDTLMLYLTGALRYVPVAALYDAAAGRHLVERYALAVYTVGGLRDALAEPPVPQWVAAGMGVSRALSGFNALPAVPGELQGVVRSAQDAPPTGVLAGTRYLDDAFTRDRLGALARRGAPFSVLHLATHFKLVPGREDESQLLLGDGDLLSLRQLRSDPTLAFGTYDLVTLSACNTSTGGGGRAGAEFEGLATTLMKKGARAVMATLWEVQDAGTARLMRAFYAARGEQRQRSKAEALRQAQLAMLGGTLRDEVGRLDFRHPYYWAPFILMGNWL